MVTYDLGQRMRPTATRADLTQTAAIIAAVLAVGCESPIEAPAEAPTPEETPDLVDPTYSVTRIGEGIGGIARAISDAGVVAGNLDLEPFLWTATGGVVRLPPVEGVTTQHMTAMSTAGSYLLTNSGVLEPPVRWMLDGTDVLSWTLLEKDDLGGWHDLRAVNDSGLVVGTLWGLSDNEPRPVRWRANGSMASLPIPPGLNEAIPWAMNNSGHIVGHGRVDTSPRAHAILWIDTGSGYTAIDLTPGDFDRTRTARYVSEVVNGFITIGGRDGRCGEQPCGARWTVDVATGEVVERSIFFDIPGVRDVSDAGDVITPFGDEVWSWSGGPRGGALPGLDPVCYDATYGFEENSNPQAISAGGVIVGGSGVWGIRGVCTYQPAVWTRIDP